jgi:hypothetical protein
MKIVKTDANRDYKIISVSKQNGVDFKIRIFDPRTGKEYTKLAETLGSAVRK